MAEQNHSYLIKIFSGPHQGAEIDIPRNQCIIGSGEDCDVIFTDSLISKEHVIIKILPESITLEALSEGVYYDGKQVKGKAVEIEKYKFISIGTTHFVLGLEGEEWPEISINDIPKLEEETEEEVEEAENPKEDGEQVDLEQTEEIEEQGDASKKKSKKITHKKKMLLVFTLAVLGLFVVGIIALSAVRLNDKPKKVYLVDLDAVEAKAQDIIKDHNYKDLVVKRDDVNEQILVHGYVDTIEDERVITNALLQASPYIIENINSQEVIINLIDEVIARYGLNVDVQSVGLGIVEISGYVQMKSDWERIKRIIHQDIIAVKELDDKVITGDEIIWKITQMVEEKKLKGDLIYIAREKYIQVLGNLSGDDLDIWNGIKSDITKMLNGVVFINDNVRAAEIFIEQKRYFDAPIQSVNIKNIGWLSLADGRRYYVGSTLPSGYVIEKVSGEGITLKKEDEEITLELGDL